MIKLVKVFKFSASGNVFVLIDQREKENRLITAKNLPKLAQLFSKEFSSDGVIFISKTQSSLLSPHHLKLVFFNPDGSRAFCGNGTRTAGFYEIRWRQKKNQGIVSVMTDAGKVTVRVDNDKASLIDVLMPQYQDTCSIKLSPTPYPPPPTLFYRVWSGCPHAVAFVKDLDKINVELCGREIRCHESFAPHGTNVDFVKVVNSQKLRVRTYERGVERETASCGSGVLAVASLVRRLDLIKFSRFFVEMPGGSFDIELNDKEKISMGGKVELIFKGEAYV